MLWEVAMLLTVRDVSRMLRVSEPTVYRWVQEKGLPVQQVNGHQRLNPVHLLEWLAENRIPITGEVFPPGNGAIPRLDHAIECGGVHWDVPGSTPSEVLEAIVDRVPMRPDVPRDDLLALLRSREGVGSTSLGSGFAVPHPRYPLVHATIPPTLAVCHLTAPIAWDPNNPADMVQTVFTLIAPTPRIHLRLLAKLMYALSNSAFRNVIARKASAEETITAATAIDEALRLPQPTPEAG
jgi:PTS system nitrogen regulatory IIA component